MRTLDECRAEVFRRSEKRIRERKTRRGRIIAFCLPFLILAGLFSVTALPAMLHKGCAVDIKINSQGFDHPIARLTVGGNITVTAPRQIQDVLYELSAIYQSGTASGGDPHTDIPNYNVEFTIGYDGSSTSFLFGAGTSSNDKTILAFIDSLGNERRFLIDDNCLIDEQTQTVCTLTAEQREQLLYLIYNKTY